MINTESMVLQLLCFILLCIYVLGLASEMARTWRGPCPVVDCDGLMMMMMKFSGLLATVSLLSVTFCCPQRYDNYGRRILRGKIE
jgi:hypothetical protein